MTQKRAETTRRKLLAAATQAVRRHGYVATSVDEVCAAAKVSKGAFFHHFETKEELVAACLANWDEQGAAMEATAQFQTIADPRERVRACMDFFIEWFENPRLLKSCLAGTTVQEVGRAIPALRRAAHRCFSNAQGRLQKLLDAACKGSRRRPDTSSLAALWIAAVQGSLILCKASGDPTVIRETLEHTKTYILSVLSKT